MKAGTCKSQPPLDGSAIETFEQHGQEVKTPGAPSPAATVQT